MVSIKQIAEAAKVSQSTASMVLNGKGDQYRISEATREKILEAARALNYQPNISARRLRSGGEKVLPIIALFWVMESRTVLISRFLMGLQQALNGFQDEYELMIQPFIPSRLQDIRSLTTGTRFNGAIITNLTEEDETYLGQADIKVPLVLYQRSSSKYSCVTTDSFKAGSDVAEWFATRGHRQVALIVPDVSSSAVEERKEGFLSKAEELGIAVDSSHMVFSPFSEQGGYDAVRRLLQSGLAFTALFAISDQIAIGALKALHDAKVRVPEEVEIVGFDNDDSTQFTIPSLSTVHLPVEEMAQECLRMLIELMNHHQTKPMTRMFETHLVSRQSTAKQARNAAGGLSFPVQ